MLPYPESGILGDIFRQVQIAHDRVGNGNGRAGMPAEKPGKGLVVAGAGAGEKGSIGAWIGLRRRKPPAILTRRGSSL
jgi:hypothetical protein